MVSFGDGKEQTDMIAFQSRSDCTKASPKKIVFHFRIDSDCGEHTKL